jgi:hypothetical protein
VLQRGQRKTGWRVACIALLLFTFAPLTVLAQDTTLSEADFWTRLRQTADLLDQALAADDPLPPLQEARRLWEGIEAVRAADGTAIRLDLMWLDRLIRQVGDDSDVRTPIRAARDRLNALIALPAGEVAPMREALQALSDVLADPRFDYDQNAAPEFDLPRFQLPRFASELAYPLLIGAAIFIVVLTLVWFGRGLRVQTATLKDDAALYGDDPTTKAAADALAAQAEAAGDLRAALRYHTLACLLLLDERGHLRYDPTLTNREHLRQVAQNGDLSEKLRPVLAAFDRVWYGFAPITPDTYQQFRAQVAALQALPVMQKERAR